MSIDTYLETIDRIAAELRQDAQPCDGFDVNRRRAEELEQAIEGIRDELFELSDPSESSIGFDEFTALLRGVDPE